ncbi:PREDICTED: uncharacterized protein LOC104593584 [Nelumbo nucifera]|uniref:MAR-binding filament-like protein 1-1 n=2 Tax=Nelumbo nucifera TaxID=4432 RepID=A0A822ZEX8_NELNU|nr:PREDICTED: uncharacterized protein LOC104593584 [Nelumbo nucifera]DAD43080.1 TPA_asm: hypothetical protein HUJ06_001310 [Nelumbo nucifera]
MALDMGFSVSPPTLVFLDASANGFSSRTRLGGKLPLPSSLVHKFPRVTSQNSYPVVPSPTLTKGTISIISRKVFSTNPRSSGSSTDGKEDDIKASDDNKVPFGYTRKDVLLIGFGVTVFGIALKSGLEFFGFDPLQAGNVVQLVMVLGLTVGWISTYIFRVSNKEMTYAQQLRDYENKVMEKRLEGLTEAELEALLEQVEEEKRRLASGEQVN